MRYGPVLATVTCTYSPALSKNARLKRSFRGRLYIDAKAKAAEAVLNRELTKGLKGVRLRPEKLWLDITVYKTRVNTDAINFLDSMADVLKIVTGVDDRYYAVKSLDWVLAPKDPKIILKLYQPRTNG